MIFFVVGWFSTDLLSSTLGEQWQSLVSFSYMVVLGGFLALMVRRLGWANTRSRKARHTVHEDSDYGDGIAP